MGVFNSSNLIFDLFSIQCTPADRKINNKIIFSLQILSVNRRCNLCFWHNSSNYSYIEIRFIKRDVFVMVYTLRHEWCIDAHVQYISRGDSRPNEVNGTSLVFFIFFLRFYRLLSLFYIFYLLFSCSGDHDLPIFQVLFFLLQRPMPAFQKPDEQALNNK